MKLGVTVYNMDKFIIAFLIVYFVMGMATKVVSEEALFPFFSWFLYAETPNMRYDYTVLIHEYDGRSFNPSVFINESLGMVADPHSIRLHRRVGMVVP